MRFAVLLSLLAGTQALPAEDISGNLFDQTGAVIAGARVMLMDQDYVKLSETKSGEQGEFVFRDVEPALYFVQAKKPRFNLAQQHCMLEPGKTGRVHLIAVPGRGEEAFTITGTLPEGAVPPPPTPPAPFPTGGRIDNYKLVKPAMPPFPESARKRGAHGTVVLVGRIETDRSISGIMTLESADAELEKLCVEAFRQWRFEPVKLNGTAVTPLQAAVFRFEYR